MSAAPNATARLGCFVARCGEAPLTPAVAEKAVICLLDALGLAAVAADEQTFRALRALVAPMPRGPSTARLWADGTDAILSEAVTANALAVHAQFHDDCENDSWSHPGSLVVPVAATLADATGIPLDRTLRAIVAGYAAIHWLGAEEEVALALIGRGVRTSPTFGTIGAAAAAAVVLGLDAARATNAVAIAASITGGVLEPVRVGSDEWRAQNAHAARGGLLAAQLAAGGVMGAPDALEGPKGLLRALAGLAELPPAWTRDPSPLSILGVWSKPWATLGDNVAVVAAAKLLFDDGVDAARIRAITIRMNRHYAEYPGTAFPGPYERIVQAIASTRFSAAAMLVHGRLDYAMSLEHRDDPAILRLVALARIEPDDAFTQFDASVEVALDDGTKRRREAREAPRTLLFHDRATAGRLAEERLRRSSRPEGAGRALAARLFEAIDGDGTTPLRALLDIALSPALT
jgi:2-methylcitrate dehydratase PrpD